MSQIWLWPIIFSYVQRKVMVFYLTSQSSRSSPSLIITTFVIFAKFPFPQTRKILSYAHFLNSLVKIHIVIQFCQRWYFHDGSLSFYNLLELGVAEVPTLPVFDVSNAELDCFTHFIESLSPLLTKLGDVVIHPPISWKPPPTSVFHDDAVTISSQWFPHPTFASLLLLKTFLMRYQNKCLDVTDYFRTPTEKLRILPFSLSELLDGLDCVELTKYSTVQKQRNWSITIECEMKESFGMIYQKEWTSEIHVLWDERFFGLWCQTN